MKQPLLTTFFVLFSVLLLKAQYFQNANYRLSFPTYPGLSQLGCGVSFCDFNGDGFDDLTMGTALGASPNFYVNNNGTFQQIALAASAITCESKHLVWVDYDNDGDKDLYITCRGDVNRLFNNDGNLNLTDVTVSAGLPQFTDPSFGATFGDVNKDGWLDLYWVNRSFGGQISLDSNYMYQNLGNGTFQNVTAQTATGDYGKGPFCATFFDYNDDGWQDLYISVDKYNYANTMLKHDGIGAYIDTSVPTGTDISIDAMNVGMGDYDNDGDEDIYITNSSGPPYNVLYRNNGNETFTNVATAAGVLFQSVSWAGNFFDFNNDTELDLYVCSEANGDSNGLFLSQGDGTFQQLAILNDDFRSFSNAIGDITNDGKLDIITGAWTPNPNVLYENISSNSNNYIKVDLQGTISNRDGVGTWIRVYANGETYSRYTHCGEGYLNQNSFSNHIGLGAAAIIDSIKVTWLSGVVDKLYAVNPNQRLLVIEGSTTFGLPLELVEFRAMPGDDYIQLLWKTQQEENVAGFEIQRSSDGNNFDKIYWEPSAGASGHLTQYRFADAAILPNLTYYYRLKIVNADMSHAFSEVISAKIYDPKSQEFLVYPNPLQSNADRFFVTSAHSQIADLNIFGFDGQLIRSLPNLLIKRGHTEIILKQSLLPGIYLISITREGRQTESMKLVVFD